MAQTWFEDDFADGRYRFFIGAGQIRELQIKCNASLGRIIANTVAGRYGADAFVLTEAQFDWTHLVEILRQGLIGGDWGMVDGQQVPVRVNELIENYVLSKDGRIAIKELWRLAAAICGVSFEGYDPGPNAAAGESPAT